MNTITEDRLSSLGMTKLAEKVKESRDLKRKLALAYEHFRFVSPEKIQAFNEKLAKDRKGLRFTSLDKWETLPPDNVLVEIENAQKIGCFDSYEIADIVEVKDPIVFGRINKCEDRFFISQWDDDVKIEDILAPNEG